MKRLRRLFLARTAMTLLLTLLTTATAWANELTVYEYEGENKKLSEYVPFIWYWDEYTKSQYIIPATALSEMAGGEISAITLYSDVTAAYTTDSEADVYLMEVDYSSFSGTASFKPKSQATIVYQGTLSFGADGKTTIEFTTPYAYSGQNLLIGFENTTKAGWKLIKFKGQSVAGSSVSGNNASNPDNITATLRVFIPQTTFTYAISGSSCAKPTLSAGSISHKGATLTVGGGSGTYNVQYALESSDEWQDVAQNSTETTFELTGLSPLTNYKARVQSVCDADATSAWQVVYFTTTQEVPDVSEGWSDDFEGTSCGWELINGNIANAWAWGTAANYGDGSKSLYISNDSGTTNAYSNKSSTMVYAAKRLYFPKGQYQISYNWRANGEKGYDFMRVALVPPSVTLTASQNLPTGFSKSDLPANWIALDDGGELSQKSDWQRKDAVADVNGTYYLVFAWRNDNSDGNNPPAAIDNVSITKMGTSNKAENLSADNITTTSASITWEGDADQWQVSYADNALFQDATETIVNTEAYDITNLQPNTNYYVKVRAYFGGTNYGSWSEAFSFKSAFLINKFPWKEDFESLSSSGSIPEFWDNTDGTTTVSNHKWCYKTVSNGPTVNSGHNDSRCIRFDSYYNPKNNTNFLKTPLINLPDGQDMQLKFWYKNPDGGDFSVYISMDGGATYTTELATGLTGKDEWTEKQISLADYAGTNNVVIVFKGTSNEVLGDAYIYLDDVFVGGEPLSLTLLTDPANGGTVEMVNTVDGLVISKDQDVDGKYYVAPGTEVTIKATPAAGHFFKNWNDNVTTDLRTFTMNNNQSFTATFAPYPTLTLGVTPEDAGTWTILGGSSGDDVFTTVNQTTFENAHFRITGETTYVDGDGLDIRNNNKIIIESLNGETITSLDVHFGYGQSNAERMKSSKGTVNATNGIADATVTNVNATSLTLSTDNLNADLQVQTITIHWQVMLPNGVTAYTENSELVKGKYYVAPGTELTVQASPAVEGSILVPQPTNITLTEVEGQSNTWTFTMGPTAASLSAIIKKQLQDSWIQDIAALTYNGSEQMPTITVKDGDTVLEPWDETTQTGDYTISCSHNKDAALVTAEDAPTVTITAVENSDKYFGSASKSFAIGKAELEVKADDMTIGYGSEVPTYTVTYTGLVGNDTESALSGTLAFSCPYELDNAVNTYTITPSGLTSDNYNITFVPGTLTVSIDPADFSVNEAGDEYIIYTATGWNTFCAMLANNDKGIFDGKTIKLGADITVSRMAGGQYHDFTGIFDGNKQTLTFNHGTDGNYASDEYVAPFRYITNNNGVPVTIKDLHVTGNIYTSAKYAAGIAAQHWGTLNLINCRSSVNIYSNVTNDDGNDGTHGGIEAVSSGVLNITGCLFDGKIISTGTTATSNCGGFVGWRAANSKQTVTNSLYAPADDANTVSTGCYTFVRNPGSYTTITNSYYTRALGTEQGKEAHSITAGDNVTVALSGTATEYDVSGITANLNSDNSFNTGLIYNNVMYAGDGDEVNLAVSNTVPESFNFSGYSVTPAEATLNGSGNDYTLTMTDADVVVTANYTIPSVNYLDMSGTKQTCTDYTVLNGTETTIGVAGEETWYVADGTVDFDHNIGIQGDVHIILKDDAVMNVGTVDTPINGIGIGGSGSGQYKFSISIYGQSTGTNQGQLNVYATNYAIWAFGGNFNCSSASVTASVSNCFGIWAHDAYSDGTGNLNLRDATVNAIGGSYGLNARNVNISGGQVKATGDGYGIISGGDVTLDWNNGSDCIYANKYSVGGNLRIADGKYFAGEDGTAYSGTIEKVNGVYPIGGKTLQPHIPGSVDYWDENGLRQFCTDYTVLDGSETALAAGWYVADGTVSFDHVVSTTGAVRIILKDGAVMNVGTADSPVSGNAVSVDDSNGSITIYGQKANSGRINAYATDYGFYADGGTVTLVGGHVMASSYSGTVCIADGKSYISEDGIVLSGTLTSEQLASIAGQTLYPYVEGGAFYLDMNGQRQFSVSCTALTGSETSLAAGWYVADGTVNFDHHITVQGDIHIILKDQAVMNVGTADTPIDGFGIGGSGRYSFSISIYGQSTGTNQGQLKVYATAVGIYAFNGNFNCSSASVTASASSESSLAIYAHNASFAGTGNLNLKDATVNTTGRKGLYALGGNLTIDGGQVTVEAVEYGIDAQYTNSSGGNVTINGGIVTASGNEYVIFAGGGNITLGWKNSTDRIYASNYGLASYGSCTVSIADGKSFVDEDGNTYSGTLTSGQIEAIAGKTLVPYITTTIAMNTDGIMTYASEYDLDFSDVSGLTAYVATGISGNTLTLTPVEKVPAGTGLLLKGDAGETFTVSTPYSATAIDNNLLVGLTGETDVYQTTADGIAFILADGNHGINWYRLAEEHCTLKANSAYLRLPASVAPSASRALTMAFEDGTTGITPASSLNGGEWYDLNGRKLDKKPTRKGLYIFNGRKTLVN